MTTKEMEFLNRVFPEGLDGELIRLPKKHKQKIWVLKVFSRKFIEGKRYSEKEVNELLKKQYVDYVTLRRDLYEFKFIDRLDDGSAYWLVETA
ncbi:MAG: DUF2087 domain-containing protein [Kurthia sp.]|nr:DUF2087 domain-containing protein [Candidatus Kurthia equi]